MVDESRWVGRSLGRGGFVDMRLCSTYERLHVCHASPKEIVRGQGGA
jgi:hypothetical protein